jgi:hypothetical protein
LFPISFHFPPKLGSRNLEALGREREPELDDENGHGLRLRRPKRLLGRLGPVLPPTDVPNHRRKLAHAHFFALLLLFYSTRPGSRFSGLPLSNMLTEFCWLLFLLLLLFRTTSLWVVDVVGWGSIGHLNFSSNFINLAWITLAREDRALGISGLSAMSIQLMDNFRFNFVNDVLIQYSSC